MALSFFALRFLGQGVMTLATRNMLVKWFETRRGLANGVILDIKDDHGRVTFTRKLPHAKRRGHGVVRHMAKLVKSLKAQAAAAQAAVKAPTETPCKGKVTVSRDASLTVVGNKADAA